MYLGEVRLLGVGEGPARLHVADLAVAHQVRHRAQQEVGLRLEVRVEDGDVLAVPQQLDALQNARSA